MDGNAIKLKIKEIQQDKNLTNEEKNELTSITDDRKTNLYLEYLGIDQLVIDFLVDALKESFDLEWESNKCLTKRKDFVNKINNKNSSATPDLQGQQTDQEQQLDTTPALPTIQVVEEQPSTNPGFLVGANSPPNVLLENGTGGVSPHSY
jgi:hypothetical protein